MPLKNELYAKPQKWVLYNTQTVVRSVCYKLNLLFILYNQQ